MAIKRSESNARDKRRKTREVEEMELRNKKRISNWVLGSCLIGIGILTGHIIPAICFIATGIYLMAREEK